MPTAQRDLQELFESCTDVPLFREALNRIPHGIAVYDLLLNLPSFIRRVCSSFAPPWGVLRTRLV